LRKAKKANQNVTKWAQLLPSETLYISVISVLELEIGILLIERRDQEQGAILRTWMSKHVLPTFSGRILAIDTAVAQRCAKLHVPGPRSDRDALIAATALVHGLTVATRNVADFDGMGVGVLNPWES
ncbi:MAG: type II toxin-antitoxin system VapC family toxin, partial [Candidatus Sulfotelmatobacter sp.]